jgi:hypothetical protein
VIHSFATAAAINTGSGRHIFYSYRWLTSVEGNKTFSALTMLLTVLSLVHVLNKVNNTVAVAPLVVIP